MKFEEYSEELQYTARVCYQLFINISHLESLADAIEDDEFFNDDLVKDQLKYMNDLFSVSLKRFTSLLSKETSIEGLTFKKTYPFVDSYPDWIAELFPYYREKEEEEAIMQSGGSMINFDDDGLTVNRFAVESSVPDSFIAIWYPIAAQVESPGFVWKSGPKNWLAYGLEL